MPKRYEIRAEQAAEILAAQKKNKDKNVEKRLQVLLLHAEGKKRAEIAEKSGFKKTSVSEIVSKYCNKGIEAITGNHYGGNHRNMSFEEEAELLKPFRERAEKGEIVEVGEILKAYEEKLGRSMEKSHGQIYTVLKRHNWRKVMPRSKHPNKASDEAIAASKKLKLL